ncbi:MAG: presqualene diphosphate synthase HpnD [Caulobacteraceae bacterium]|nr:presqualene diphosphate synthase HpnD [Caulobacteraceae bacterium]
MSEQASLDVGAIEQKVSGSSFYAGMRVLPKAERSAMFAIYAFCRAVDDIVDEPVGELADRIAELDVWRRDVDSLYAGGQPGRMAFLAEDIRRFGLVREDFQAVIDGMQMDLDQDIRGPDLATLDLYCDRVASAVGRLSVKVFGMAEAPGIELAFHLGRALQLTNILRDLDEDAGIGRLYLPREFLDQAGITGNDPSAVIADPRVDTACRAVARIAHEHYRKADAVMAKRPAGRLAAPRLMSAVYSSILAKMEAKGWAAPRERAKIGKIALLWIVLSRGLMG